MVCNCSLRFRPSRSAAEPAAEKNVLIINGFSDRGLDNAQSLEAALRARVPWPVTFYVEYLETRRFENAGYEESLVETLRHTYGGEKLDLVIVEVYPALRFALKHRDELFAGVPIVFMAVDPGRIAEQKMWPGVTGVTVAAGVQATIDLALHLHPPTNAVAIITTTRILRGIG